MCPCSHRAAGRIESGWGNDEHPKLAGRPAGDEQGKALSPGKRGRPIHRLQSNGISNAR